VHLERNDLHDTSQIGRMHHTQKRLVARDLIRSGSSIIVGVQLFPKILHSEYERTTRPDRRKIRSTDRV